MLDLSQPATSMPILVVDFEASSKDPLTCEPCEVAVARFEGGNNVGVFSSLLRTNEPMSDEAIAVHGVTNEMTKDAPTLAEVSHEILKLAQDAMPCCHNRSYDRTVMHRYLSGEGVPVFDPAQQWLCTLVMARHKDSRVRGQGRHRLAACCKRRGIVAVGAHRAQADVVMAGKLFYSLMEGVEPMPSMAALLSQLEKLEHGQEIEHAAFMKECREKDRVVWRQYAAAALSGLCGRLQAIDMQGPTDIVERAAETADLLLSIEKERFK